MQSDFISREAAELAAAALLRRYFGQELDAEDVTMIKVEFDDISSADVVQVVHARWVKVEDGDYYCSHCLIEANGVDVSELDYCPKCAARMDGGEHHAD